MPLRTQAPASRCHGRSELGPDPDDQHRPVRLARRGRVPRSRRIRRGRRPAAAAQRGRRDDTAGAGAGPPGAVGPARCAAASGAAARRRRRRHRRRSGLGRRRRRRGAAAMSAGRWSAPRIAGVAVGAVLALLLLLEAIGWPFLRGPVQRAASDATGVAVTIEAPFRARFLFGPHVEAGRIVVAPAHGLELPHFVDAGGVQADWRWGDIRRWRAGAPLRLEAVQARSVDANLLRRPDGRASWQLGDRDGEPRADEDDDAGLPRFGLLAIERGRITVDDQRSRIGGVVELRGSEGEEGAGIVATARGHYREHAVDLSARAGGALPLLADDAAGRRAPPVPLRIEGRVGGVELGFDGRAAALVGAQRLDGALRLAGPSLAAFGEPLGLTLPRTPPFVLTGAIAHDAGVWSLKAQRADIGRSRLAGSEFRFDGNAEPGKLTGRLVGDRLLLADLGPAVGTDGKPGPPAGERPADARVLPQREFSLPALRGMDADVQVAVDELDFGTAALAPVRELRTRIGLADAVLRLDDLQARVAGGRIGGRTELDSRADPARWLADLRFDGTAIEQWIRGLRREGSPARGGGGESPAFLTGTLDGTIAVTGRGRSTAQILGTLNGRGRMLLRDGSVSHLLTELAGIDLAQAIGVFVRGDESLPLRCARLEFSVDDGLVVPQVAVIDNRDSTVRIDGSVSLSDETLALRARTRPKDFSPLSLRTPVLIGGHLGKPEVGLDAKQLAGRAAAAAALAIVAAPAAALLPFVDAGQGEKGDPCTDPAPAPQAASGTASNVPARGR
ncbi:MAG: AsmA family protein [Comamonadaceae bacterium]|nr:AsmA family protein [Comamonadaceae bacterium]